MRKKADLSYFGVGGLDLVFKKLLLGFSKMTISKACRKWCEKRKYPVSGSSLGINANQSVLKSVSEYTTHKP